MPNKIIPFEKSFASSSQIILNCWDLVKNNNIEPREMYKSSAKKFWFNCKKCNHDFNMKLCNITNCKNWCVYCTLKKLCENKKCKICYNKSFASSSQKILNCWDYVKNNNIEPRNVFKSSVKKFWFNCYICNHSFTTKLINITNGIWCIFCANLKLCEDNNCKICYNKSFASFDKIKLNCWDFEKNNISPRNVNKRTHNKYYFICNICNYNFEISLDKATDRNQWCQKCTNKTEKLFLDWLNTNYSDYTIIHQPKFKWCKSPSVTTFCSANRFCSSFWFEKPDQILTHFF